MDLTTSPAESAAAAVPKAGYAGWLSKVEAAPYRFDFYQTLRHIEAAHPHLPRLGEGLRPGDEPLRLMQSPDMTFAPASLQAVEIDARGIPRLSQRIFGLLGPNGPMPSHFSELVRERSQHHGDNGVQRFLDTFTHRFALLFYRAWAQSQPALSLDRPNDHGFTRRLGALSGIGSEALLGRDAAGDRSRLHFTGRLARHVRDADGLSNWCRSEFDTSVVVDQWHGHWMTLGLQERTRLRSGRSPTIGQQLGRGAVLGASVWDVQHKFRIVMGPLCWRDYEALLPGGENLPRLMAMVRHWVGLEFEWDLKLILARADICRARLGRSGELGRSGWVGRYKKPGDADDLVIHVERSLQATKRTKPS